MLVGAYQMQGEIGRRLLGALPPLLVLPRDAWDSPLVPLLADEITKDDPGQEAVLDRLLDLLLIAVLRAGVSRAALARRFSEVVGEPPIKFLTGWRLALAADLLRGPDVDMSPIQPMWDDAYAALGAAREVQIIGYSLPVDDAFRTPSQACTSA